MKLRALDLNLLPVLHALIEECSVSLAAHRVGLSVSATSHALARIREQFDDPILVRAGRSMQLTRRAKAMRIELQELVRGLGDFYNTNEEFIPSQIQERLTVQTPDSVSFILLNQADQSLRAEAPHLDIHTLPFSDTTIEALRDGRIDLGIGVYPTLAADIESCDVFRDDFVLVLRKGHPALGQPLSVSVYAELEHALVAPRGKPGGIVDKVLAKQGLQRRVARTTHSFFAASFLVAQTDYALTMSRRMAFALRDTLPIVLIEPPIELPTYTIRAAWHKSRHNDPLISWFVSKLKTFVESPLEPKLIPFVL